MYEYKDAEYPDGLNEEIEATNRVYSVKTANDEYKLAQVQFADGKDRTELVGKDKETYINSIDIMANGSSTIHKKSLVSKGLKFVKFMLGG